MHKCEFNKQCITFSQMNMISNARLFWRRFTAWIRVYMISRYAGLATEEEAFGRLYFETAGIGNFLQVIFELESSNTISQQFRQFTIALRDLINAQLLGDQEAMQRTVDRLYQNVSTFADYLATVNPYIDKSEWNQMMNLYIQYTIEEANAFVTGNYAGSIGLYGRLTELTNKMGDIFAEAIFDYINSGAQVIYPSDQQCVTYEQMDQIYTIRMFWFELVTWIRAYMLSRFKGVGSEEQVKARLNQLPKEFVEVQKQFFGSEIEPSLQLIETYIDLIDALITAQMAGDTVRADQIVQLLYQNADQRAEVVASANPFWDETEWRNRLYNHLRNTIDYSLSLQAGDYHQSLDLFRTLLDQAESASGYYAKGAFEFITSDQKE